MFIGMQRSVVNLGFHSPSTVYLAFETGPLISLEFMDRLDYLATELQRSACVCLLDAGITSMCHVPLHQT